MADKIEILIDPIMSQDILGKIDEIGQMMNNKFTTISQKINDQLKKSTNGLGSSLPDINKKFKKTFETVGKNVSNQFSKIKANMENKLPPGPRISNSFKQLGGLIAGAFTVGAIKNFAGESIELYKAQNLVEVKLKANMKTVVAYGGDLEKMNVGFNKLMNQSNEIEGKGVVGADVLLSAGAQLSTFQLSEKSISKLLPGIADMLANTKQLNSTQADGFAIANQMGRALSSGNLSALVKSGIMVDENTKKMFANSTGVKRASLLQKILADNVGNVNQKMGETPEGQLIKSKAAWEGMQESIGKAIIPMQVKFASLINDHLPQIEKLFLGIAETVPPAFDKIVEVVTKVVNVLKSVHEAVGIDNILVFVGAFMGATKVIEIILGIVNAVKAIKTAVLGVNLAMSANPIGLIVAGIALLGYIAYKNFDKIKAGLSVVWGFMTSVFEGIKGVLSSLVASAVTAFSILADVLMSPFRIAFNILKTMILGHLKIIEYVINKVISGINTIKIPGVDKIGEVDFTSKLEGGPTPGELVPPVIKKEDLPKNQLTNNVNISLPPNISPEFKQELATSVKKASDNETVRKERQMGVV